MQSNTLLQNNATFTATQSYKLHQQNPADPIYQMTLALGAWHQEELLLQQRSAVSFKEPRFLPNEIHPPIPNSVMSHPQS